MYGASTRDIIMAVKRCFLAVISIFLRDVPKGTSCQNLPIPPQKSSTFRLTRYPELKPYLRRLLVALVAGLLLLLPAGSALADSYDVSAKVPAPLPADLPVITTPDNNSVQDKQQVPITGTCIIIDPQLIVVLERDGATIGSGVCRSDGTFSITIDLVLGRNIIRVKFMTITGESGGYGAPISLLYAPASVAVEKNQPVAKNEIPAKSSLGPLVLTLDYDFVTYSTSQNTPIKITVSGGVPPYRIFIAWGDSSSTREDLSNPGSFIVNHLYRSVPDQAMKLLVKVQDTAGTITQGERALVSFEKLSGEPPSQPTTTRSDTKVLAIWFTSMVGVMLLATLSYSSHFLGGTTHGLLKAKQVPIQKARVVRRGKK